MNTNGHSYHFNMHCHLFFWLKKLLTKITQLTTGDEFRENKSKNWTRESLKIALHLTCTYHVPYKLWIIYSFIFFNSQKFSCFSLLFFRLYCFAIETRLTFCCVKTLLKLPCMAIAAYTSEWHRHRKSFALFSYKRKPDDLYWYRSFESSRVSLPFEFHVLDFDVCSCDDQTKDWFMQFHNNCAISFL